MNLLSRPSEKIPDPHIRDSSDGVAIVIDSSRTDTNVSKQTTVPIEVKSRCAPRTCHIEKLLVQHNQNCTLYETSTHNIAFSEIDAFVSRNPDDSSSGCKILDVLNPILHHFIPSSHELIQILHHAVTYNSTSCFFFIGNDKDLMAIYIVHFPIVAYQQICDYFYSEDLAQLYAPGEKVPDPPAGWMDAFITSKLRGLKMDEPSFNCHVGLWQALNIDLSRGDNIIRLQSEYALPLSPTSIIVLLPISTWKTEKGGGDTSTKLTDICQERFGI